MEMEMPNIIKGLFFDLDGTLCDTNEANYLAYKKALKDCGYVLSRKDFKRSIGLRADKFIPLLFPDISLDKVNRIRELKADYYLDMTEVLKPNKHIIDFFLMMKPDHITVLVTTASKNNAQPVLKKVGLTDMFNFTVYGDDVDNPKPDPEAYSLALALSGLRPDEVIAFEDSESGILSAVKAGIKVIRVKSI